MVPIVIRLATLDQANVRISSIYSPELFLARQVVFCSFRLRLMAQEYSCTIIFVVVLPSPPSTHLALFRINCSTTVKKARYLRESNTPRCSAYSTWLVANYGNLMLLFHISFFSYEVLAQTTTKQTYRRRKAALREDKQAQQAVVS
ncbi:hypothetical protein PsorP6_003271 [Peronosclerospora sorghi]|uniref:Uncharacterized protein n=1 Tax=Peronosclerospora sorghi TaxID=230839 RepID=A0ACC0VLB8_9STRA|nr:hypothetical protein PsorP6_003271 [Peronosclerospora sorghi]